MFEDQQLPGMLGSFNRFNVHGVYWPGRGWVVTFRHRHCTDALNCPHVIEMEHMTVDELVSVFDSFIAAGGHTFTWDSAEDRCVSDRPR